MATGNNASLGPYIKGVFCLEGEWSGDLKGPSSMEPILQLLQNREPRFAYIHRFVVRKPELAFYLQKWALRKFRDHPILYLACHGDPGIFYFNSSRRDPGVTLDDLEEWLGGKCKGRIICFGSCGSLDIGGPRVARFLDETKALAVCGYKGYVDWIASTAFDLFLLAELQGNAPTVAGMRAVRSRVRRQAGSLATNLGFRMVVRKVRASVRKS